VSKVFEMLQDKVESIRGQLGNTADVLGMLDDINVDSLIMESIRTTNRRVRRKKSWKNSSTNASGRSRSGTSGV